jgi:catechol 2,3-dioxygenase-like lactoylglutathione lyase family enzyme
MTVTPAAPISLNHIAYPTWDSQATYDFYTRVMRCAFLAAIQLDSVPSVGAPTPFLHTFYGMSSGEAIAFFEVEGLERPTSDPIPSWIRHIAVNVADRDELVAWQQHLKEQGVEATELVDHDGTWESLYLFDPNGVRIELTVQSRELDGKDAAEGLTTLEAWNARRRG